MPSSSSTSLTQFGDIIDVTIPIDLGYYEAATSTLSNGQFVVVWTDNSQSLEDASVSAIHGQIFNADGSLSGSDFLVNTTTFSMQETAKITTLSNGQFVVSWMDFSQSGGDTDHAAVRAQIFDVDGAKSGGEFVVNTTTTGAQYQAAITALTNGKFVVTWQDTSNSGGDTSVEAVRAQIFNADGTTSGSEFLVNTITTGRQRLPDIAALSDGKFVISWEDRSNSSDDGSFSAVRAQMYNSDGTAFGSEFLVNTTTDSYQNNAAIAGLSDGKFVIIWRDYSRTGDDTDDAAIRGQIYYADGTMSGGEFLVNTTTAGHQGTPEVTALPDGAFMVSYTDWSALVGDTSDSAIRAQIFRSDGTKSGDEFLVNVRTQGEQYENIHTHLGDGRVFVSYTDFADVAPWDYRLTGQFLQIGTPGQSLNGGASDDQFTGSDSADTFNGLAGHDTASGGLGADTLSGGSGNDTLYGGGSNDTLTGGGGHDSAYGNAGSDRLFLDAGNDMLNGGAGQDWVHSTGSRNVVINLAIDTAQDTGRGQDTITNIEHASGGEGADQLSGNGGANKLHGNNGIDTLLGKSGNDTLWGGDQNDLLKGGLGRDVLQGDAGKDTLFGGAGADKFVFRKTSDSKVRASKADIIKDFQQGQDKIDLHFIDASTKLGGNNTFTFKGTTKFGTYKQGEVYFKKVNKAGTANDFTMVYVDTDNDRQAEMSIKIMGLHSLTADDFIL